MAPPARAEAIPPAIAPNIITSLKWLETNNLFNNLIQRNQSAAFSSGKVRPNHETNINIIARRTGKDVNSHTVLDGIITTIMATIQRINIIGSREGSRNRRRLKANQTGKKFRVGIKSNISTNRNNLISRSEERFSRNAETDIVCRLLLEKKKILCFPKLKMEEIVILLGAISFLRIQTWTKPSLSILLVTWNITLI